jgi:hypothetical protein
MTAPSEEALAAVAAAAKPLRRIRVLTEWMGAHPFGPDCAFS